MLLQLLKKPFVLFLLALESFNFFVLALLLNFFLTAYFKDFTLKFIYLCSESWNFKWNRSDFIELAFLDYLLQLFVSILLEIFCRPFGSQYLLDLLKFSFKLLLWWQSNLGGLALNLVCFHFIISGFSVAKNGKFYISGQLSNRSTKLKFEGHLLAFRIADLVGLALYHWNESD